MNSLTDNEQDLLQHRKDTRAILPYLRDGERASCFIGDPVTLQRIKAQTLAEKDKQNRPPVQGRAKAVPSSKAVPRQFQDSSKAVPKITVKHR